MEKKRIAILALVAILFIVFMMPKKSRFSMGSPSGPSTVTGYNSQHFNNATQNNAMMAASPYETTQSGDNGSMAADMSKPMGGSWAADGISSAALIPREVIGTDDFGNYDPSLILSGQNYLDPRSQIGYPETLGGVLRNANRQERSEPINPRDPVSIFNLSTIPPDLMRPNFEIDNDYL
jgi:hypothetical protein